MTGADHRRPRLVVDNARRVPPPPAPRDARLTAQDVRFLESLAGWPLRLTSAQRAWLRHIAAKARVA